MLLSLLVLMLVAIVPAGGCALGSRVERRRWERIANTGAARRGTSCVVLTRQRYDALISSEIAIAGVKHAIDWTESRKG